MTRPARDTTCACLFIVCVTLLVFRRWLFAGNALYWGDTGLYFFPLTHFLRENLLQGRLPLWDPAIFGGVPFIGNPQMWPLYPSTPLLVWLSTARFLTVSCVLHVALTGLFFFLFLRRGTFGISFWPALLGAAGWMLGGYFVSKAQYPNMLQALAWTPLVLLLAGKLARAPSGRVAVQLGAALGLQLLAAHAQVTLYTVYLAIIYGVFVTWTANKTVLLPTVGWGMAAVTLALTLSCAEWLPVVAARRLAVRQVLPLSDVNRLHLAPIEWTNFLLPWRYGSPLHGDYTGPSAFWETACYAGTLIVVLALFCVLCTTWYGLKERGKRCPNNDEWSQAAAGVAFWAFICLFSIWLACGASGGLFRIAYRIVPGFQLFHDPARLLLGAAIGLPILAALGLETLSQELRRRGVRVVNWLVPLVVVLTALDLAQFDTGLYPLLPNAQLENLGKVSPVMTALRTDQALTSHQGRVLAVDDDYADNQYIDWLDFRPERGYWGHLGDTTLPNLPLAADVWDAGGYEPLALRGPGRIAQAAGQLIDLSDNPQAHQQLAGIVAPWMGLMAVRDVVVYRPTSLAPLPGLIPILRWRDGANEGTVYRNAAFQPRARSYWAWSPSAGSVKPASLLAAFHSKGEAALDSPLIENASPSPSRTPAQPMSLVLTSDTADDVCVALPPAAAPTLCVLADTDFPGWHATLDRHAISIHAADGVYRGVFVAAHSRPERLEFRYRPEPFLLGFYLTGLAVMFLTFYGMVSLTRRRKH